MKWVRVRRCQPCRACRREESFNQADISVFWQTFPLMTNSVDQVRIEPPAASENEERAAAAPAPETPAGSPREIGGREGPEPTRFGDWELRGRCIDF
jgi:hypothetical protein